MSELTIENLSAAYRDRTVLRDVSLAVGSGQVLGLIGPNGAGKTTLLRAISGGLVPTAGSIRLGDPNLLRLRATERARRVAVVPQGAHLPEGFTVAEVVLLGRTPHLPRFGGEGAHDREIARQAMVRAAIWELRDRWVGELSGGERQRVLLARSGLIVIAALHDLNLAALYADRLALLCAGRLLTCDTPSRVLTPELLRRAYDVDVVVGSHPLYHTPLVALVAEDDTRQGDER